MCVSLYKSSKKYDTAIQGCNGLILKIHFSLLNEEIIFRDLRSKNRELSPTGLKNIAYLTAYTGSRVTFEHVAKISDEMADLADELS